MAPAQGTEFNRFPGSCGLQPRAFPCIHTYGRFVTRREERFVWDSDKATANFVKHGVSFDEALEVFFDVLYRLVDASIPGEAREAAIGLSGLPRLLFVVSIEVENDTTRIISARPANAAEKRDYEKFA